MSHWPEHQRTYRDGDATPWMPTGDARTGLPFLLHQDQVPAPHWHRVWLPVDQGDEVVALDVAFPATGHSTQHPIYLVLHGLNGGSQEEYVKEFAWRRTEEGSTVVVLVARGLMDLPVRWFVTFTTVPRGRVLWAAVMAFSLNRSPEAVFLPWKPGPYQDAPPH